MLSSDSLSHSAGSPLTPTDPTRLPAPLRQLGDLPASSIPVARVLPILPAGIGAFLWLSLF
jgi:hypothetical protein